jgi:hypothetical protein
MNPRRAYLLRRRYRIKRPCGYLKNATAWAILPVHREQALPDYQ